MTPSDGERVQPRVPGHRARSLVSGLVTVGTIGFGGGSALIPLLEQELVERRRLLRPPQFLRQTIVANITPGALPVKMGAFAGLAVGEWKLALAGGLAVALPGVAATVALLALSEALGPNAVRLISYASVGITAFIVVLLAGYIIKVHATAHRRLVPYLVITVVSALATGGAEIISLLGRFVGVRWEVEVPRLNAVMLILVALALIVVTTLVGRRRPPPAAPSADLLADRPPANLMQIAGASALSWLVVVAVGIGLFVVVLGTNGLELGALLGLSSITSFGGGEAYIGVADGYFVATGMVNRELFYTQLVPIANALPGPILLKVAAGIGYLAGLPLGPGHAWALAGAATLVTTGGCVGLAMPVLGAYVRLKDNPIVVNIGRYILPVICGLLVSVSATMLHVAADVAATTGIPAPAVLWPSLAAIIVMTRLHLTHRVGDLPMLLGCGALSLVALIAAG